MRAARGARGTFVRASRKNWISDAIATRASAAASLALVSILNGPGASPPSNSCACRRRRFPADEAVGGLPRGLVRALPRDLRGPPPGRLPRWPRLPVSFSACQVKPRCATGRASGAGLAGAAALRERGGIRHSRRAASFYEGGRRQVDLGVARTSGAHTGVISARCPARLGQRWDPRPPVFFYCCCGIPLLLKCCCGILLLFVVTVQH